MYEFSLYDIVANLLLAARWTVVLSLAAFAGGGVLGLVVLLARVSSRPWLSWLSRCHIEVFQGTPLLMQLFLTFFGLSLLGIDVPAWLAAFLALTVFTSAFLAEIWRGCVESVARGQWEASASLGLGYMEQMRWVILPQALRIAVPPTVGFSVQVVKGTAVTSIINFIELTKAGVMITNATLQPMLVYGVVALIYFALCFPLSFFAKNLERKLHGAR